MNHERAHFAQMFPIVLGYLVVRRQKVLAYRIGGMVMFVFVAMPMIVVFGISATAC